MSRATIIHEPVTMPSLLIDIYKTNDIYSGLGQFSYNFAKHLCNAFSEKYELHFLGKSNIQIGKNCQYTFVPVNWQKRFFPGFNKKYDLWHSLHQFPSHKPSKHSLHILTIHDLNFLIEKKTAKANKYMNKLQKNIDHADVLTVISEYTKQQVLLHFTIKNKPVYTIHNGVELSVFPGAKVPDYIEDANFFFTIGVFHPKKNFHVLIPLMHSFPNMKLVIAGNKNSAYAKKIEALIYSNNLKGRVILPGEINDEEKYWLYTNCKAFLFPSIAEGFGLPVIEAMLAGKPVFLSKYTSLPEIGGSVAYYWESFNADHMTEVMHKQLKEFQKNSKIISGEIIKHAQKFSWNTCIQQYLKLYDNLLCQERD